MKLPLFVACLVAGSSWSFAFADVTTPTGNPKTAARSSDKPTTQLTRAQAAAAKVTPTPIQNGINDEANMQYAPAPKSARAAKNGQGNNTQSPTAPAGGILGVAAATPAEDACTTPVIVTVVSGTNLYPFDNTLATTGTDGQAAPFGCNSQTYASLWDVWYQFTAPWTGTYTVMTCGQTAVDTKLVMYNGAGCPTSTFLACSNNSAACSPQSRLLDVYLTNGQTVTVQLGSSAGGGGQPPGTGNLEIDSIQPSPPPPNDNCAAASVISGPGAFGFDNSGATEEACDPLLLHMTTNNAGGGAGGDQPWSKDIWYDWKATWSGTVQIQTCNSSPLFDSMVAAYPMPICPCATAVIASNDDGCGAAGPSQFQMPVVNNTHYVVRVTAWGLPPGAGTGSSSTGGLLEFINTGAPPAEDNCATPLTVFVGSTAFSTIACTTGAQGQTEALCLSGGSTAIERDAWFKWTDPGAGGCTKISNCGGTMDSKLAVYPGGACPTAGTAIICNDDSCGTQSAVSFIASPGATYMIQLGSYPTTLGAAGTLLIAQFPVGAGNDDCSGATATGFAGQTTASPLAVAYDNSAATTGCQGQTEALCALESGGAIDNDLWYTFTAVATNYTGYIKVTTCGLIIDDSKIAAYAGAGCPTGSALACRDNTCGTGQTTIIFPVTSGAAYTIQIGNAPGLPGGAGNIFTIEYITPPAACDPWDDGTSDIIVGWFGANDYGWMNRFGAPNVTTTITSVDASYGVTWNLFPAPAGTPTDIFVWQDGLSQDGDPSDATLLSSTPINITSINTDILDNYPITPVTVTGYFFVGTHLFSPTGISGGVGYQVAYDRTIHDWPKTSWEFRQDGGGAVNAVNLLANTIPVESAESQGYFGQHPIRANCSFGPTNTCCQPGFGTTIGCPCLNPPSGLGRGCGNKDSFTIPQQSARLTGAGNPSLTAPLATTLVFTMTDGRTTGSQVGILLQGKVLTNGVQFGHGVRCFGAFLRVFNHPGNALGVNHPALGTYVMPAGADVTIPVRSAAAAQPIPAGAPRYYQMYYRDAWSGPGGSPALCAVIANGGGVSDGQWCFWAP